MACCFLLLFPALCSCILFNTVQSEETHLVVEKGQYAIMNCALPSSVKYVIWQVFRFDRYINASICIPNSCTDHLRSTFKGNMVSSPGGYTSTLDVYSATTSDTQFLCLTDTGYLAANITLDIFELPSTPTCRTLHVVNQYLDLICETPNVYPSFTAKAHRMENDDFEVDQNATSCTVDTIGTGSKGDSSGICTWRIPNRFLLETNTFYIEMTCLLSNGVAMGETVFSPDTTFTLNDETHVVVEKGERAVMNCSLPSSVKSVIWQVFRFGRYINASTCSTNSCTDHLSSAFKGNMVSSPGGYTSTLDVYSATTSDTQFLCLTDTGSVAANITLDIYVLPSTPTCRTSYILYQYVELICETSNVYPTFGATPHRRENNHFKVDQNATSCIDNHIGTGSKGDSSGICTWRIPYRFLLQKNTFYVEMNAHLWNGKVQGRPVFSLDSTVTLSKETHVIVEKGKYAVMNCGLPSSVKSVIWQVFRFGRYINASTCSTNSCTDQLSSTFKGNMVSSPGGYTSTLEVHSATTSDTQFLCLTDTGSLAANITLDIYALPSTPTCRTLHVLNKYVDLICETSNVYPNFTATPHRTEIYDFEFDEKASGCHSGIASNGDISGNCTWRIPYSSLLEKNTFYVEMKAQLLNGTLVGRPVFSSDINVMLSLKKVTVSDCPTGRCMWGQPIKRNAVICCKCELTNTGVVEAKARWFKQDETVIGTEDFRGHSSTVTIVYNASDPHATYDCRAVNPSSTYYHIAYQPDFSSSSLQIRISRVTFVMGLCSLCCP